LGLFHEGVIRAGVVNDIYGNDIHGASWAQDIGWIFPSLIPNQGQSTEMIAHRYGEASGL